MAKEPKASSPTPKPSISFLECIQVLLDGGSVSKKEWGSREFFGKIEDGRLRLHKPDGQLHDWILSDGDLAGQDYFVI